MCVLVSRHSIFDGLTTIFEDVQPFLDAWQERIADSLGAAERFAQFIRFNDDLFHTGKALRYEGRTKEAAAQVQEWLRGPSLIRMLDDWLVECKDDAILWCLSEAIELLADYQGEEQ
jgi:hypothetical protein